MYRIIIILCGHSNVGPVYLKPTSHEEFFSRTRSRPLQKKYQTEVPPGIQDIHGIHVVGCDAVKKNKNNFVTSIKNEKIKI
jgi:hypothetical protein